MPVLELGLTLGLLILCGFAPGFFLLRRLRWTPMEKLCGSVGLSLILLYLFTWGVYTMAPSAPRDLRWLFILFSTLCAAAAATSYRELAGLFRCFRVRASLAGFGFVLLWTFTILSIIRHYSGASWSGDWLEHFNRTLYFLDRFPTSTLTNNNYRLPARPPMMNVLTAYFLAHTRDLFELFQAVFVFLNLLVFLPCCLMMPALGGRRRMRVLPLVGIFAMNPVVMQAATYTWTKSLCAFYVVLAFWFYLAGWRKQDPWRTLAGFVALSAGLLVHYAAGHYCVLLALHYLWFVFRFRPRRWRELAAIAAAVVPLLLTWFGWSLWVYGPKITFASNSSVAGGLAFAGRNLEKIGANLVDTIIPAEWRDPPELSRYLQGDRTVSLRDRAFVFYQVNLPFGLGVAGAPVLLWLLYRSFRRRWARPEERRFWLMMIPCCIVLGIAVVGERDHFGLAHLTLLPLQLLGLSLLAARFSWRRPAAVLIMAGCAVDFSMGILLHARVQNLENTPSRTVFPGLTASESDILPWTQGPDSLPLGVWTNWFDKHNHGLAGPWMREIAGRNIQTPKIQQLYRYLQDLSVQGETRWYGWFSRHGGSLTFFGDHFAGFEGGNAQSAFLIAMAAGLLGLMGRAALRQPRSARAR